MAAPAGPASRTETCPRASPSCCPPASTGPSCPRAGLRVGLDLLAPDARMAAGRRLRPLAPGGARPAQGARAGWTGRGPAWTRSASARKGGALSGPNPTDRGTAGSKYHLLVDATGLPLHVLVSAANRHDSLLVGPILDGLPGIKRGGRGHPRRRDRKSTCLN